MAEEKKKETIPQREERWLLFWKENKIFEKSLSKDAPMGDFVFYDGPPFATGEPHYGHLVGSAMKDAVPRYKTMRGYRVARQWGWDCHGLPIENIVEKEVGTKSKKDIEIIGVKKFNELCREKIFTYVDVWNDFIPRFGRWADMERPYRTMDRSYMESEWWAFKQLYDKGLIYEDYRSLHICPRCETTLAQSEVAEGYQEVTDLSLYVKFELSDEEEKSKTQNEKSQTNSKFQIPNSKTYFLAWTTTAWTLPGNVALAVGSEIEYAVVEGDVPGDKYIMASELVEKVFAGKGKILRTLKGSGLEGKKYKPLFPYYADDATLPNRENGWKIYTADFVTTTDGTGIVHIAPAFGEDDLRLGRSKGLPFVQHVGMDGVFRNEVKDFVGIKVKPTEDPQSTDVLVLKYLAEKNLLFAKEKFEHSYPHCWRCDTPLLNYATSSWFVAVEKIKPELEKYAPEIVWSPAHIKEGRWMGWLSSARDWSISRQRFWANTIPVWRCVKCKKDKVFGSASELEEVSGLKVLDLHRDGVDDIIVPCECGGERRRVPDVLDTWFDSGSVPFAALHYPFENKELAEKRMPADYIGEGQDQVSKWFYYQHVLSGALFRKRAFTHVIVNGIVLAEDGKKMGKRFKNYPDPRNVVDKYGADAMRLYLLSSPAVRAENLNFSEEGVADVYRKTLGRLDNVASFFELSSKNIRGLTSDMSDMDEKISEVKPRISHVLDRWVLARLAEIAGEVTTAMEAYELDRATRPFALFVDDLSTWYVRRSRERAKSENESDRTAFVSTLRHVLLELAKLMAPFAPFFAEDLYHRAGGTRESVHLESWPALGEQKEKSKTQEQEMGDELLTEMAEVRRIVSLGLEARAKAGVKVRQPLARLGIRKLEFGNRNGLLLLVKDETNVKEAVIDDTLSEDVVLDATITPELREEGALRDLMRAVQDMRKEAGLQPHQLIRITFPFSCQNLAHKYETELKRAVKATDFLFADIPEITFKLAE